MSNWPVRQGGEQFSPRDPSQRYSLDKFFTVTQNSVIEVIERDPTVITTVMDWEKLRGILQDTDAYRDFIDVTDTEGFRDVIDTMYAWMTIAAEHPDKQTSEFYDQRAQTHAVLQYCCLSWVFWKQLPDNAEDVIRSFLLEVATEWDVSAELMALDVWNQEWDVRFIKRFLGQTIGVVGRHNKQKSDPENIEFRIRAKTWQFNWLSMWMWIQFAKQEDGRSKAKVMVKLVKRSPVLASMIEYYVSGDRSMLELAREKDRLVADVLLLRFARRDSRGRDESDAAATIKSEFERRFFAKVYNYRHEMQDIRTKFFLQKVYGSVRIVPDLLHNNYIALIRRIIINFIAEQLRPFWKREDEAYDDAFLPKLAEELANPIWKKFVTAEDQSAMVAWMVKTLLVLTNKPRRYVAFWVLKFAPAFPEQNQLPEGWFDAFYEAHCHRAAQKGIPALTREKVQLTLDELMMSETDILAHQFDETVSQKDFLKDWRDSRLALLWQVQAPTVLRYAADLNAELQTIFALGQHPEVAKVLSDFVPDIRERMAFWCLKYAQWYPERTEPPEGWIPEFYEAHQQVATAQGATPLSEKEVSESLGTLISSDTPTATGRHLLVVLWLVQRFKEVEHLAEASWNHLQKELQPEETDASSEESS